jgi:hypothetical protein
MADLAHDTDNSQIEREISIADAISNRQIWCNRYLSGDWQQWDEDIMVEFLRHIPTLPFEHYGHGVN